MVSHCMVLSLDLLLLPVCKEEVAPEHQERSSSLVQEEPGPPQIKEEHEEEADVSTVTSLHWDTRCDFLSGKTMLHLSGPQTFLAVHPLLPPDLARTPSHYIHICGCIQRNIFPTYMNLDMPYI